MLARAGNVIELLLPTLCASCGQRWHCQIFQQFSTVRSWPGPFDVNLVKQVMAHRVWLLCGDRISWQTNDVIITVLYFCHCMILATIVYALTDKVNSRF